MTPKTADGHPGVWGPDMESPKMRQAYDEWLAEHPAPSPRAIVPARAWKPKRGHHG